MVRIVAASENALIIYLAEAISPKLPALINTACHQLKQHLGADLIELVPAYTSILVYHSPQAHGLPQKIQGILKNMEPISTIKAKHITIPVFYHKDVAADLHTLADNAKLSPESVIEIHSQKDYSVYAVGFSPAFAYLGKVDPRIASPRLDSPRDTVPAGSVAIANQQTAVYPSESPAGWNIIGRTPLDLSLKNPKNLTRFKIGDRVSFYPIGRTEFLNLGGIL